MLHLGDILKFRENLRVAVFRKNNYNLLVPAIKVQNITKNYGDFQALKGVSFEVEKNEIFGILGPNGAGKTTTLEIIEGLKKQTSGKCEVLGFDNLAETKRIKEKIGVQLQNSEYLNFLNLSELLNLFAGFYGQKINPIEILKQVGLEKKAKSEVKELSGGQKQKFTVASALVHKPEILFLDEPTTGLDPQARRNTWSLIKNLHSQGITIILTTHYMEEAEYLCTRVAIMDSGKILKIDSPQSLIEQASKAYKLSFFIDKEVSADFFSKQKGVLYALVEYPKVVLEVDDMESTLEIAKNMKNRGVKYSFLNIKTGNLEDVYLRLTGREYQENNYQGSRQK